MATAKTRLPFLDRGRKFSSCFVLMPLLVLQRFI